MSILKFDDKCGELTLSVNDELLVHCIFCEFKFLELADFIQHIKAHRVQQQMAPLVSGVEKKFADILQIDVVDTKSIEIHETQIAEQPIKLPSLEEQQDEVRNFDDYIEVDGDDNECQTEEEAHEYIVEYLSENEPDIFEDIIEEAEIETDNNQSAYFKLDFADDDTVDINEDTTDKTYNVVSAADVGDKILQTDVLARERLNNKEVLFELISLYETHSNLWDTTHENYQKLKFRNASYNTITEDLRKKFPMEPIKREMVRRKVMLLRKMFYKHEQGCGSDESEEICKVLSFLGGRTAPMSRKVITPNADGRYECPVCTITIKQRSNLTQHMRRHYKQYLYECSICYMKFYNTSDLKIHQRLHTNERPYTCEVCGKSFRLSSALQRHLRTHYKMRDFKCHLCEKAYYWRDSLALHLKSHSSRKEVCEVCGKQFFNKKYLKEHMRLHSGEKKYVCGICEKAFSQQSGLSAHKRTHKLLNAGT